MSRVKVVLSVVVSVFALLGIAVVAQQYNAYFNQRQQLLQGDEQNRRLLQTIEPIRDRQAAFSHELEALSQRYESLRRQIPVEMQLDTFKKQLGEQYSKSGLKVLAQREARFNRAAYEEVRLSYSLKGNTAGVQQVVRYLQSLPRLVVIKGPQKESKENTGLIISIFSVKAVADETVELPKCIEKPDALLFPFLNDEIDLLFSDYQRTCDEIEKHIALHNDMQRHQRLGTSVRKLEQIRGSLLPESP